MRYKLHFFFKTSPFRVAALHNMLYVQVKLSTGGEVDLSGWRLNKTDCRPTVYWCVIREASRNCDLTLNFSCFKKPVRSCSRIMFYKMLFDRFVDFAYLYTVLDMPRQILIVCLHKVSVLCFVNNGLADKTSTEPGLLDTTKSQYFHNTGTLLEVSSNIVESDLLYLVS